MISSTSTLITSLVLSGSIYAQSSNNGSSVRFARQKRAASQYPTPDVHGPAPLPEWVTTYNTAKAAGKIPNFPPTTLGVNGSPVYPVGTDASIKGACSWTTMHCFGPNDVVDAPTGMWGVSFDDGPQLASPPLYTFLKHNNVKASHFMIGSRILGHPDIFQQAVANGDHIAVHTWSHPYTTTMTDLQILGELGWTIQIIYDNTGLLPAFWRPPYGDVDNRVRAIAAEVFGLYTVIWNHDTNDWCLQEGGVQTCKALGPQNDAGLDAELKGWINGPKTPGIITLQHELTSRSVGGFIRNFPSLVSQGWAPKNIPDMWSTPWYHNAQNTFASKSNSNGSIASGSAGGPGYSGPSSNGTTVSSNTTAAIPVTTVASQSSVALIPTPTTVGVAAATPASNLSRSSDNTTTVIPNAQIPPKNAGVGTSKEVGMAALAVVLFGAFAELV